MRIYQASFCLHQVRFIPFFLPEQWQICYLDFTSFSRYCRPTFFFDLLGACGTNSNILVNFLREKKSSLKWAGFSWSLDFNSPKDLFLKLPWNHSSCSERISWEAMGVWLRIHSYWQRLMHRLLKTIIFPNMIHLKCKFKNVAEICIILLFTNKH